MKYRLLFKDGIKDKFPQELHKLVIKNISCQLYRLAMETNNIISYINYNQLYLNHTRDEVDSEQITFIASHPLPISIYLCNNPNSQQILRRTSKMGVNNLGGLITLQKDNPQNPAWLQIMQGLIAFPKLWVTLLTERNDWQLIAYTNKSINVGDSIRIKSQYVSTKQIRLLLSRHYITPVDGIDIIQKHSLEQ